MHNTGYNRQRRESWNFTIRFPVVEDIDSLWKGALYR